MDFSNVEFSILTSPLDLRLIFETLEKCEFLMISTPSSSATVPIFSNRHESMKNGMPSPSRIVSISRKVQFVRIREPGSSPLELLPYIHGFASS